MAVQYLRIQVRRDSAANWAAANPVLLVGEVGFETDTKRSKTGDGVLSWSNLAYDKAGIVSVDETSGLNVDDATGVLSLDYDHSADLGDLGGQTVKVYVDAQDGATLQTSKDYTDAVASGKADVTALTVETTARIDADAVEKTNRENSDNNLQGQINANLVIFNDYTGAAGIRFTALEADPTTQSVVDSGDASTLAAAKVYTDTETTRATAAEGTLTSDVADNTADIATNTTDITTLKSGSSVVGSVAEAKKAGDDAQATADGNSSSISTNTSDIASLNTAVGTKIPSAGGTVTGDIIIDPLDGGFSGNLTGNSVGHFTGKLKATVDGNDNTTIYDSASNSFGAGGVAAIKAGLNITDSDANAAADLAALKGIVQTLIDELKSA